MNYNIPFLDLNPDLEENLNNIEKVIDDLNRRRDKGLDKSLDKKLKKHLLISQVYHSNAIEGNKLSLRETELILDGMVINERPLKDEIEARSLANATDYLYKLIDGREPITRRTLLELHGLIMENIPETPGGQFRVGDVKIKNSDHIPPPPALVEAEIDHMFQWMNRYPHKYRPLVMGSILHHWLTWVHPFSDGNGRVGRMFLNFYLLQKGYPEVVIKIGERDNYYESLIKADKGDVTQLVELIAEHTRQTVNVYEEFINENERQSAWKARYKFLKEAQYKKAKETYAFQYEVFKNQISVFRALLYENIKDISKYLSSLEFTLRDYEALSFSQYLDILEDRKVSNTWYINIGIYDKAKKYKINFVFYFERFKFAKPINLLGTNAKSRKSGKEVKLERRPQIKLYVSARRNQRSEKLKPQIELVNVGTWGDQLSFGVINRDWRPGRRNKRPRIITVRENPGRVIRKFIDQILNNYFRIDVTKK